MIFSTLLQSSRYVSLHPLFQQVFDYMRETDLRALAPGRYPIEGEDLFLIIEQVQGRKREQAKLEAHQRYIDIQLVLKGVDEMGWKDVSECHQPIEEHCTIKDIRFFDDVPASWVATPTDSFCIFFPEDAHAPLVSDGIIRKAIFKVAVNPGL